MSLILLEMNASRESLRAGKGFMVQDSEQKMEFFVRGRRIDLTDRALVMGIVNCTIDSFSDGGKYLSPEAALDHARRLIAEGADIIDVGGESTRPGAMPVSEAEEMARVVPVIEALSAESDVLLSVDTSKPGVALAAVTAGAHIVNDVSGLRDPAMLEVLRESGAGVVIMHMQGTPETMQNAPHYEDVVAEVRNFFRQSLDRLLECGLDPRCAVFDPGIGFGKTLAHNLQLLKETAALSVGGRPLLIGVSRKSFLSTLLGDRAMERRAAPTVALTGVLRAAGARIFRVHEVRENTDALRVTEAVLRGSA